MHLHTYASPISSKTFVKQKYWSAYNKTEARSINIGIFKKKKNRIKNKTNTYIICKTRNQTSNFTITIKVIKKFRNIYSTSTSGNRKTKTTLFFKIATVYIQTGVQ